MASVNQHNCLRDTQPRQPPAIKAPKVSLLCRLADMGPPRNPGQLKRGIHARVEERVSSRSVVASSRASACRLTVGRSSLRSETQRSVTLSGRCPRQSRSGVGGMGCRTLE
jgi:hypothetical protein